MDPRLPRQVFYSYQPLRLDEIRVLRLHAGPKSGLIVCTLMPVSLNDKPDYQALSYEWGKREDIGDTMVVNGLPHLRKMQRNLELSLKEIRHETEDVILWVDAICINQEDNDEKGQQVAKMGDVYRNANNVIAWLGPERDGSDDAMDLMANRDNFVTWAGKRLLSRLQLDAVIALLHRSYWKRVWIIQELQLARSFTVRCGSRAIPGDTFQHCIGVVTYETNTQFHEAEADREKIKHNPASAHIRVMGPQTLHTWLDRCLVQGFKATDGRDYIYGLLAVSRNGGEIVPDYNLDSAEVLRRAIPVIMQGPGNIFYPDDISNAALGIPDTIADFLMKHPLFGYVEMMGIEDGNVYLISDILALYPRPGRRTGGTAATGLFAGDWGWSTDR